MTERNRRTGVRRLLAAVLSVVGLSVVGLGGAGLWAAEAQAGATREATFTSGIANGWARVERWRSTETGFIQEAFPPDGRGDQTGQRVTFFGGDASPHSSRFLMYFAPNYTTNPKPVPVLLVHGANQDADIAFADPNEAGPYGCGVFACPSSGMMQSLVNDGFKVFAISFPHKNGDNYFWAEQIADAIAVVKSVTGASKVDVVTWSKSVLAGRMYASSVRRSWAQAYRGDIRRLIFMGGAQNGTDGSFRHGWTYTFTVFPGCGGVINGPVANERILCYGLWRYGPEWTYASSYFTGSAQLLKRWDSVYPLSTLEQDWYTTYYGGTGLYTVSPGIDAYLSRSLIDPVRAAGVPSSVQTFNLCGNQADIALLHNEHTGPSDGVVFVNSCTDSVGMPGHRQSSVIAVNHLELGWVSTSLNQIKAWLNLP